jgi:hypothetical protein
MLCIGYGRGPGGETGEGFVSADTDPSPGFELSLETALSHKGRGCTEIAVRAPASSLFIQVLTTPRPN